MTDKEPGASVSPADAGSAGSAVTAESPVAAEAPALSPEDAEAKLDAELGAIWDKNNSPEAKDETGKPNEKSAVARERGPDGKFKAKETSNSDQAQPKDAKQEEAKAEPAIERPKAWSADKDAVWASLSPEAKAHVAQREKEAQSEISRLGQTIAADKPVRELLAKHKDTFERNGISVDHGIAALLDAQDALDRDPVGTIAVIAERYGISRQQLAAKLVGGQIPGANPAIASLEQKVAGLEQQLVAERRERETRVRTEATAAQDKANGDVRTWSNGKPYFDEVRQTMADLMMAAVQRGQTLSLDEAYDQAVHALPAVREKVLAAKQAEAEAKRKADKEAEASAAKRNSALNAGSARQGRPTPRDFMSDDWLSDLHDRAASGTH